MRSQCSAVPPPRCARPTQPVSSACSSLCLLAAIPTGRLCAAEKVSYLFSSRFSPRALQESEMPLRMLQSQQLQRQWSRTQWGQAVSTPLFHRLQPELPVPLRAMSAVQLHRQPLRPSA